MLHFPDPDNIDWDAVAANGGPPFAAGPNIAQMFGYSINPCISDDDQQRRARIAAKVDRPEEAATRPERAAPLSRRPTFPRIAVSPNEFANTWDVFGPLIEERLWPNPRYSWLSGVLQHRTNRVAPPSDLAYFIDYNPNPNAAIPAPET